MKPVKFHRVCIGIYTNHEYGFRIEHQCVWQKHVGRKWEASWLITSAPGIAPHRVTRTCDTFRQARDLLNELVRQNTRTP